MKRSVSTIMPSLDFQDISFESTNALSIENITSKSHEFIKWDLNSWPPNRVSRVESKRFLRLIERIIFKNFTTCLFSEISWMLYHEGLYHRGYPILEWLKAPACANLWKWHFLVDLERKLFQASSKSINLSRIHLVAILSTSSFTFLIYSHNQLGLRISSTSPWPLSWAKGLLTNKSFHITL